MTDIESEAREAAGSWGRTVRIGPQTAPVQSFIAGYLAGASRVSAPPTGEERLAQALYRVLYDAGVPFESASLIPKLSAAVRAVSTPPSEEWEYGQRGDFGDGHERVILDSMARALGGVTGGERVKRRAAIPAGPWEPVPAVPVLPTESE